MTLNQKTKRIRDALVSTTDRCYHYRKPPTAKPPYIVWQEDSEDGSLEANNRKQEQQIHGTADLYTLTEFDPLCDAVQTALNSLCSGWRLNLVTYEDETNLIHHEWEWWVI